MLKCAFVNLYALNDDIDRDSFWDEPVNLVSDLDVPVCLGGDFNVVRRADEKIGCSLHKKAMEQFNDFIEKLGVVDFLLS
ncbi:hypothetical protein REPUB_Repub18cG0029800 [Reevesia pubescens]